MKNFALIIFIFSSSAFLFSQDQKKIKIIEEKTNFPISYATCFNKTSGIGMYSDSEGELKMDSQIGDTLIFSCMAYDDKTLIVTNKDEQKVQLKRRSIILGEVKITSKSISPRKRLKIGYKKRKKGFSIGVYGTETARFVNDSTAHNRVIQSLKIPVKTNKNAGLVRLHIYSVDSLGFPQDDLIPVNVVLCDSLFSRKSWVIDISEYNILFPESGVYISTEYFFQVTPEDLDTSKRELLSVLYRDDQELNNTLIRNKTRKDMYDWVLASDVYKLNMNFAFHLLLI